MRTRTRWSSWRARWSRHCWAWCPVRRSLLIAGSVLAGVTRGIFTLVQATAITDRWGAVHYGQLNGLLTAPVMLTAAIAPWAGSAMAGWLGGYPAVFVVLGTIGLLAAALSTASVPR